MDVGYGRDIWVLQLFEHQKAKRVKADDVVVFGDFFGVFDVPATLYL